MIGRYNRLQILKSALATAGGLACCSLAYLFFGYGSAFVASRIGHPMAPFAVHASGCAGLLAVAISGYRTWKKQGGLYSYHESSLYHDLGQESVAAFVVDHYAHKVTAPAYVVGQLFLAGPLLLLRARTLLAGLVPNTPELLTGLENTLAMLGRANKWQSISEYPHARTEILYLAQMGFIEFSAHKGIPRIKARLPEKF